MKDAILKITVFDYDYSEASITFGFGNKRWSITNAPTFGSSKAAENQAKKLAKKLGFNITKVVID